MEYIQKKEQIPGQEQISETEKTFAEFLNRNADNAELLREINTYTADILDIDREGKKFTDLPQRDLSELSPESQNSFAKAKNYLTTILAIEKRMNKEKTKPFLLKLRKKMEPMIKQAEAKTNISAKDFGLPEEAIYKPGFTEQGTETGEQPSADDSFDNMLNKIIK